MALLTAFRRPGHTPRVACAILGMTCLGSGLLLLPALEARAQVTSVNGTTSAGLQFGSGGNDGITGRAALTARSETQTTAVTANGALGVLLIDGDTDVTLSGRLTGVQRLKRGQIEGGLSYERTPFSLDEIEDDLSLVGEDVEGERDRFAIFGGFTYELDALTSVSTNARYTRTDFDPVTDESVPSDDYRLNGRVTHALDRRNTIFGDVGLGWFTSENNISTESLSVSATVGGTQQANNRTTLNGSLGVSFINTEETVGGLTVTEWSNSLLLDIGADIAYADGTLSLGFAQEVDPGAAGELQLNSTLRAGFETEYNSTTTLGLDASYQRQQAADGDGDTRTLLSVSPYYAVEMFDGINATARYTLRNRDDNTTHRFNIGLSRDFGTRR